MKPMLSTPSDRVWGHEKFMPAWVNPQVDKVWARAAWARFVDYKPIIFQPKEGITLKIAIYHLESLMQCDKIPKWRRWLATSYLCNEWFEGFQVR
jgi:hypothetical protein